MASNIYFLLGLEEGASLTEIKKAYARLVSALENDLKSDPAARSRLVVARERLSQAYEALKQPEIRKLYDSWSREPPGAPHEASEPQAPAEDYCRPRLGQLLVASGLIAMEELDAALEIQRNTGNMHVPLGELLVAAGYLTPQQLDYYLRMQRLMKLPSDHPKRWGQRLVELGLVSEDELKVSLIEQKMTGCTLRQALINRGYLTAGVLDRIF